MSVDKTINFTERAAQADTPATGDWRLYFKSGGLYTLDDAGTETLVAAGSGANAALSNLAAVAINTSLISDTDSTDDLGSTSVYWRNAYLDTAYFTEQAAPATPAAAKVVIYPKADGLMYSKDDAGVETLMSSGASGITASSTDTLTNKTIDADGTGNVITNIGSSEVKAELITGLAADATPDSAADYVMTYDASATALKKVLLSNLPSSGGLSKVVGTGTYTPGANITTNSTTHVDIDATNVVETVTLNGSGVVIATCTLDCNKVTAGNMFFRWTNGTTQSDEVAGRFLTAHDYVITFVGVFDGLAAGSTTFKPQFRSSDANNAQIIANLPISWSVVELS